MIINLNENIIKKLTKTEYEIVKFINNNQKIQIFTALKYNTCCIFMLK